MKEIRKLERESFYNDNMIYMFEQKNEFENSFFIYFEVMKNRYDSVHNICFRNKLLELLDMHVIIDNVFINQKKYYLLIFEFISINYLLDKNEYVKQLTIFFKEFFNADLYDLSNDKIKEIAKSALDDREKYLMYKDLPLCDITEVIKKTWRDMNSFELKQTYSSLANEKEDLIQNLNFNKFISLNNIISKSKINIKKNSNNIKIEIDYCEGKINYSNLLIMMLVEQIFSGNYASLLYLQMREVKNLCYCIESDFLLDSGKIKILMEGGPHSCTQLYTEFLKCFSNMKFNITDEMVSSNKERIINYILDNLSLKEKIQIDLIFNSDMEVEAKLNKIKDKICSITKNDIFNLIDKLRITSVYSCEDTNNE